MEASEKTRLLGKQDQADSLQDVGRLQKVIGLLCAILWVFCMIVSSVSVQLLEKRIPDFELNAFRCFSPLIPFIPYLLVKRKLPKIPKREISGTIFFFICTTTSTLTVYVAASLLPLATLQCITQSVYIASGVILYFLFLGEKPSVVVLVAAAVCLCGVFMVIQPDFIFSPGASAAVADSAGQQNTTAVLRDCTQGTTETMISPSDPWWIDVLTHLLPACTGLTMCFQIIVIRKRPFIGQQVEQVLFWVFVGGTLVSLTLMALAETPVLPNNWSDVLYMSLHCLSYVFVCPAYMYAASRVKGTTLAIIASSVVMWMLIAQYTILSSIYPGHRNWIEIVGAVMVFTGAVLSVSVEICKQKAKEFSTHAEKC